MLVKKLIIKMVPLPWANSTEIEMMHTQVADPTDNNAQVNINPRPPTPKGNVVHRWGISGDLSTEQASGGACLANVGRIWKRTETLVGVLTSRLVPIGGAFCLFHKSSVLMPPPFHGVESLGVYIN